jgi:tetratricopeptide (TPR) repeat protein
MNLKLSGGHPLALILLVQLIDEDEDLSNILDDNILWMGDKGEVAVNILDKVYEERLNEKEKKFLQYVSLYRSSVPIQAIVAVAKDPGWDKVTCKELALQLKRKSLLEKTGGNYWEKSLISIYAYNKLDDIAKHHKSACDYFISLPLPEERTSKEDIQPLIEAYYHACRAKEYNIAAYIIFVTKIDSYLDLWGNYRTLVELYTELLPKNHFKDKPLIDIEIHSFILFNLGNIYIYLGEIKKAIEYIQAALTIYKEIYDRDGESGALGKLGNAYSFLDDNEKAINCYQEAIKISQEIDDRQNEGVWVGELGKVYNHIGKVEKAIQHFQEALDISREVEDKLNEGCFLGNLGNIYLHQEVEKAIEYYHNAIQISQENEDKHNEGIWMGNLGLAYSYLNETEKAIEYYQKAIKISQKIDNKPGEGVLLGNLGLAYISSDKVETGIKYCQKALTISQETGDRSNESIVFSSLGNAYILLDDIEKAIDCYQNALIISQEINYRFQEGTIYLRLGRAFTYLENFEMASENFKTAMAIGREIKDPMMIGFCEKELKSLCF